MRYTFLALLVAGCFSSKAHPAADDGAAGVPVEPPAQQDGAAGQRDVLQLATPGEVAVDAGAVATTEPEPDAGVVVPPGEDAGEPACGAACCNGKLDTNSPTFESDIDCGGPVCRKCDGGETCIANTDCESRVCNATKTCTNPCMTLTAPEPTCMCKTNAGKAYFFCPGPKDFNAARAACMGSMADLVAIEDIAEQTFLEPNVTTNSWIGAAIVGTTSWVWAATGTAVDGAYANWQAGHPVAVAGWCAVMQMTAHTWVTMACTQPSGYVCEQR